MQTPSRLQVILLAAGASKRMGRDKATLPWDRQTLIEHVASQFPAEISNLRIVANPANAAAIQRLLPRVPLSINAAPNADMLSSLRIGIAASAADHGPLCIHPIDIFAVTPQLVRSLQAAWTREPDKIHAPIVSSVAGQRRGHPIIFPWKFVSPLDSIPPEHGLNWLLRSLSAEIRDYPWPDERLLADLDTPADYKTHRPR